MEDQEIEEEIRRLALLSSDKPEFFGPVANEVIEAAEHELGVRFPRSYRVFLHRLGAAFMMHKEFDGLPVPYQDDDEDRSSVFTNLVETTKQAWKGIAGHGLPRNLVYVTGDGGEYTYFIDVSRRDERDECPIVVMGQGAYGLLVADDFLDFVRKLAYDDPLF